MTIKRRIESLERSGTTRDGVVFISTGVPRHDKVGRLAVAISRQGWLTKHSFESDGSFKVRALEGYLPY